LYDVLPKISISNKANDNGIIKYHDWDEATTARATVAEGGVFQSLLLNSLSVLFLFVKSVILLVVTEEFGEDSDAANAELNRFLDINVNFY
jgi:hypothetical protein